MIEDVACVYFGCDIVEGVVVAVGYYGLCLSLEACKVVHYFAAEEGGAVFKRWFVYDYFGSFGFYAFHYALDGGVAKVVAAALHCEAIYAYGAVLFALLVVVAAAVIVVIAGFLQYLVGNEKIM